MKRHRVTLVVAVTVGSVLLTGAAAAAQAHQAGGAGAASGGGWGTATEVPGLAALNTGGFASVSVVSCGSPGNCSAGGTYGSVFGGDEAFVAGETNGTWGKAEEVPGSGALNTGGNAQANSMSCASAGNCSAGGSYADEAHHHSHLQAFVVTEKKGTWGTAEEIPGAAALNVGGGAQTNAVSCPSAGHCSAGGSYTASSGVQAFVVTRT